MYNDDNKATPPDKGDTIDIVISATVTNIDDSNIATLDIKNVNDTPFKDKKNTKKKTEGEELEDEYENVRNELAS